MPTATAHSLLELDKPALVERDGLPRAARYRTEYSDGASGETQHVLYLEAGQLPVRSMEASAWLIQRGPLPVDPTQPQIDAAILARQQATQQAATDAVALRQQVITLAQSSVGIRIDLLTAPQVRSLLAILLWKAGGLNNDGTIKALADWVR